MNRPSIQKIITSQFGLETLPESERAEIIERLLSLIGQGVSLRVANSLSDEQAKELEALIEQGQTPEEYAAYLASLPGYSDMVIQEIQRIKENMVK